MKQIVASQGNTWDQISYEQYGSEFYITELMSENSKYIDTVVFSGGEVLNIPEISETEESLPPWRQ